MSAQEKPPQPRRIVVIGAVAAGTSAAAKARRNDETSEIVVYERDEHISYSGCGLPYYIGGLVKDLKTLTPRDPAFFKSKYNVDIRIKHEVIGVDPKAKTLTVRDLSGQREFSDHYDTLILATGATSIVLPVPGADLPHVFSLRNPTDARAIRAFIEREKPRTAAIIGSGFIGLEMVENLAHAGLAITLVEKLPQITPFVDPDMAPYLQRHLESHRVEVLTGRSAERIESTGVRLDDETFVEADMVIMAVGIRPNVALAREAGVEIGSTGAIAVNEKMQTSLQDIFACGDCAESYSIVDGRKIYRPLGSTANKMGRIAGDAVTGGSLCFRGIAGTGIFRVFDMSVAAAGLNEQQARESGYDVVVSHNIKPDKPDYFGGREMVIKSIIDRKTEQILGAQIIGYEGVDKRIDVLVTAMTAGLAASALMHLDLAYAPPFATTKDPIIYTGMILDNAISRGRDLITAEILATMPPEDIQVVDARVGSQYATGHVDHAVSMPHESLREQMAALDKEKPVVTYCNKGNTGNAAQNILINRGFRTVYNLSGGHRQYLACKDEALKKEMPEREEQNKSNQTEE